MPRSRLIYGWDSCVLLTWIKDEPRPAPGEREGVLEAAQKIHSKQAELLISDAYQLEVLDATLTEEQKAKLANFTKRTNVHVRPQTVRINKLAADLQSYYVKLRQNDPKERLVSALDAVHLATSIYYEVTEFHTFDNGGKSNKYRSLLAMDGNVAGHPLKICKPPFTQYLLPGLS